MAADLPARQGDVIVMGEATGHAHRLREGTILQTPDGTLYLDVTQTTQVVGDTVRGQPQLLKAAPLLAAVLADNP